MSATSSISSVQSSSNSGNSGNNTNSSNNSRNVISSGSNIVILDNQILDSNDVVAAAGLQQLSGGGAGGLKLTRDCAVQYSNVISSYTASSNQHGNATAIVGSNSGSQMNTVNIIPGDASQTNSRVQVLSNVQLVSSKGASQPSTFSYVDASGKNFNVLTSSGKISTNKLIGVPITKVKTFNHIGQQPQQHQLLSQQTPFVSSQLPQQQPQQLQTQIGNVQKVTVPRNIQLVTRIPNSTISVSNGRMSQITPSSPQQQQSTPPQFTIQQYADSSASIPPSLEIRSSVSGPIINSTNATGIVGKTASNKGKNAASLKMMQNSQITQSSTSNPTKPIGKSMSVNLKSVRNNSKSSATSGVNSQYYIKNSSNGTLQQQQSGTTTSIYTTSPAQAVYHNPTPVPPQQSVQIPVSTTTTTGKGRGVYKTSKNQLIQIQQQQQQQQQQHQPPPHQSPQRSITPSSPISGGGIPQNITYGGNFGSTTMVQGNTRYQNYNSYPIPASQSQSSSSTTTSVSNNYKPFNHHLYAGATSSSGVTFESSGSPSTVTMAGTGHHDHPIPSVTVTGYSSSTGKNKKYGSTIQNESNSPGFVLSPVKMKGSGRGRNNSISNYQPTEATAPYQQRYSTSPSRPLQQQQFQSGSPLGSSGQHPSTSTREDQIFLNGQQMTDESSARILQSLSQRSTEPARYGGYKQQQQFTFYGSDNVPQQPPPPPMSSMPAPASASSNANTTTGVSYDPSNPRFFEDKSDGRRTSISEVITYADNIPLLEGYPAKYDDYNHPDDNIIEEVRPAPVDVSNGRFHILQAVLQDHTYFAPSPELKLPDPQPPPVPTPPQQTQQSHTVSAAPVQHHPPPLHHHHHLQQHQQQHPSSQQQHHYMQQSQSPQPPFQQQQSLYKHHSSLSTPVSSTGSTTVMTPTSVPVNASIPPVGVPALLTQMSLNTLATITGSSSSPISASTVTTTTPTTVGYPPQPPSIMPGSALDYIYQRQVIPPQDDDANSVISTGSRNYNNLDIDLGEETETAPEGEGEDDSVTRCICDLTHDDGYMICCDKCSAWQHVDCMGIDRANIPDEYNCEMCQPRPVDRIRARTLQLEKRKEQSLLLANNNLQMPVGDAAVTSTNLVGVVGTGSVTPVGTSAKGANQYTTGKAVAGTKKAKSTSGSSKKKSGENAAAKKAAKKALDALNRINGKRKELKKPSKKKIKTTEQNAEKMSNMIRTWIDNYERAITNHYSPELRARLTAFGKMQSQNPLLNSDRLIPAGCVTNLAQKCTTVPHAGGKILISIEEIPPKTPIIEIRGKYMLSSQHKQLQSLFNMAANGKLSNNKNAGPFLFLYQVTQGGMELCVDTRTYGNDARFVRRSCRPNAEILHNVEKGVVHLYVVSTANIKANTEITIKHDEQLIQRVGGVIILTHTTVTKLCACGLIKDCQYSAQLSDGLLPAANPVGVNPAIMPSGQGGVSSSTTPVPKASKSKKNNGALGVDGEKKAPKKRNSRSTSSNAEARLRSISSSGDSTSELMMYAQQQPPLSPLQPAQQFQPTPSQLVHQQLQQTAMHFMQQQQQGQPGLMQPSQPVYMYSPSPTHQSQPPALAPTSLPPQPPVIHPQTSPHPPPMSPVMNIGHRTGFYAEIKSPMNSPPPLNLTGPPPLVIPSMPSPVKASSQHPPPLQPMSDVAPPPPPPVAPMNVPALTIPNHSHPLPDHLIQQQHQIMEDIIKIKIKSPKASPMKHEYSPIPSSTITPAATTSMLSPPPPPPIPVAQRPRCAETLKQELFQSHYQPPVRPQSPAPPVISSPVKVEYPPPPVEVKQEPQLHIYEPPHRPLVIDEKPPIPLEEIKTEPEVKPEPVPEPEIKLEEPKPLPVKIEAEPPIEVCESAVKEEPTIAVSPAHDMDSKDGLDTASLCDSVGNSPVKSTQPLHHTTGSNPGNSAHSSPHSTSSQHHSQHGGSSSKKKNNPFKETEKEKKEKPPSRKLTREERKMEAIVKAFEKMEQSQQRKQELKEQRKEGKRRSVSSSTPDESAPSGGSSSTKKKSLSSQKRKKKKSKSLSQHFGSPNQSRKKKVSKSSKKSKNARVLALDPETPSRPYESKAAELLLTFSQQPGEATQPTQSTFFGDDVKPLADVGSTNDNNNVETVSSASSSNLPLLSSACMLIEAAVGPLEQVSSGSTVEQDFKFPQKAKTKKSMSREWLSGQAVDAYRRNTPDQDSGYMSEEKSHEYRRVPFEESSLTTPLGVDVSEPNICIVAKKVEEFIAQNSPQAEPEVTTAYKWDDKVSIGSTAVNNSQEQTHTPTSGGNVSESAAAKKRWLRQAISEETDELLTQASSSPPPPNGFTTPLKKRRVIRQSDEVVQTQSQQQQPALISAQKIDFVDSLAPQHQPQQQQPIVINSQQKFQDGALQWSNSVPPPLSYPFGIAEDKQAMDLSRTAVPPVRRIQPYKIVPIAQALTPLHFADPGPLPTPSAVPVPIPQVVQAHHHLIPMEAQDTVRATSLPPPPLAAQQHQAISKYEKLPSPPPSAVAAMVPASLLPPEVTFVVPPAEQPQQQPQARIDVSYPSSAPVPGITRSKGSQKYIGSPAKFQPPSPSESLSSSVAETPEKNSVASSNSSGSLGSSDVDDEAHDEQAAKPEMEVSASTEEVECSQVEMAVAAEQESVTATESFTTITSSGSSEPSLQQDSSFVQEEQVIMSEIVHEEHEVDQMDQSDTVMNTTEESSVSQMEEVCEEQTTQHLPERMEVDNEDRSVKPVVNVQTMNGRDKSVPAAPAEDSDKSELEDLQKVIASFHSENIMNLISRNKKSKKVVSRENSSDEKPRLPKKIGKSRSSASSKEGSVTPPAPPSPPPEEPQISDVVVEPVVAEATLEVPIVSEPEPVPAPVPPPVEEPPSFSTLGRSYSHPSWYSTTDSFRETPEVRSYSTLRPDIPQINYNSPSTYQSKAARELLSSLSAGSEPLSSFTSYRTSTSSFLDYPKSSLGGSTATTNNTTSSSTFQYKSSSEISSLLDKGFSSTRPSSFSTLGPDRSTERVGSSFLLSSTKVTDNLSTLGSAGSPYPKIFTKTAGSDPRLNPALTAPEPPASVTPKRKLSINEYRQRKMQSTTTPSSSSSSAATSTSTTTPELGGSNSSSSDSAGSNQITSSLGSNDVSSSICKELELELGEENPTGEDEEAAKVSSNETSSSKSGASKAEPNSTEATV